jgi:hypothetical protein
VDNSRGSFRYAEPNATVAHAIGAMGTAEMNVRDVLTYEVVSEKLRCEEETGKLFWRVKPSRNVYAGAEAGSLKSTRRDAAGKDVQYRYVRIDGFSVTAAQVVWLLHYGVWPETAVKYEDGNPLNLRVSNLYTSNGLDHEFDKSDPAQRKEYHRRHREKYAMAHRESHLKRNFDIGTHEFNEMVAMQGNRCAICKQPETQMRDGKIKALAVDHDHETGWLRGLLCSACNTAIGKFNDDPRLMVSAINYINDQRLYAEIHARGIPDEAAESETEATTGIIVPFVPKAETK